MTEFRKFIKIRRVAQEKQNEHREYRASLVDNIKAGMPIMITEKLDGANAGIEVVKDDDKISYIIMSHNNVLNDPKENDLRGWYGFAQAIILPKLEAFLKNKEHADFYFYGEWLVPHTVAYQEDMYSHWYLFSIFDKTNDHEFTPDERLAVAQKLGLKTPDVLFNAAKPDADLALLESFVGKSQHTYPETNNGEGIVIECGGIRAKIRSKKFREVKHRPQHNKAKKLNASQQYIEDTLTQARFDKMVNKFKDENKLPELVFTNFGKIASPLSQALWNDILSEEPTPRDFDEKLAHKYLNRKVPKFVRALLNKQERTDFIETFK